METQGDLLDRLRHCAGVHLVGLPRSGDNRAMVRALALVLLLPACKEEPGWWCRDAEQAKRHHQGEQVCWRAKTYCDGMCKHQDSAVCYSVRESRSCFATRAQCDRAQEANAGATTKCAAAWE